MSTELSQETQARIEGEIDAISTEMIDKIRDAVTVNSEQGAPAPNAPFGPGPRAALDHALATAASLGFETRDLDGYCGYAEWPAGGADALPGYVAAVGHVDVVPAGDTGWKHPAYSGYEEDGVIYSRGMLDNKGPIYSCLYALAALKRLGLAPRRAVRIVFGCNEETGMACMRHYNEVEPAPVMGFTPDCKWPVVYAERGRSAYRLTGSAGDLAGFFGFMNAFVLNAKNNGERFGIDYHDDEFGTLEVRNYKLELGENGAPALTLAVSYPAGITAEEVCRRMTAVLAGTGIAVEQTSDLVPVRFERDSELVRALTLAYDRANTGFPSDPVTTTGGTYAKVVPNIVPFGPSFPGQKGIGHQPNEWMKVSDIVLNAKIYAMGLYLISR